MDAEDWLRQEVRAHSRWLYPWKRMRCCRCDSGQAERHHPSYHSFDVIWLCRSCHAKEHEREFTRDRTSSGQYKRDERTR